MSPQSPALKSAPLPLGRVLLLGTLVSGVLDATDGVVAYGLLGLNPIQVLQYIASGVQGKEAFAGGLPSAALGAGLHFLIAFVVTALYAVAARNLPLLRNAAVPLGLLYGALVYLVMTYGVLPLSAVAPSAFSLPLFLNGVIGHALFVGLPIALLARRMEA